MAAVKKESYLKNWNRDSIKGHLDLLELFARDFDVAIGPYDKEANAQSLSDAINAARKISEALAGVQNRINTLLAQAIDTLDARPE